MDMKRIALMILGMAGMGLAAGASTDTDRLEKRMIERSDDVLLVDLTFNLSDLRVSSGQSVVYTPLIRKGDSLRVLPQLIVNGRARQIIYDRASREADDESIAVRRLNGKEQRVDYHARVPYAAWMDRSEMVLVEDDCGCGWKALGESDETSYAINLAREPRPLMAYVAPKAEVKTRSMSGSAYLDFPVNQTVIRPDYRRNTAELAKIRETIDQVRDDRFATITGISIKGYASPEGTYANNERLAKGRSEALLDYVKQRYDLAGVETNVDYEPEDWAGLEKKVEASDLPDKAELLAIIRADEPADWDAREWKLKNLNGGSSYRYLLNEIYPALRHSDYEVDYTIRPFNVDESKSLIYKDPKQLSLEEMFQVAQTCESGSPEFKEVFEIAVRMYPDDPVSNLNAAVTAIHANQPEKARRYLAKAADCPERQLAEAALLMHEGKLAEARTRLEALTDTRVADTARENLRQITLKEEENK